MIEFPAPRALAPTTSTSSTVTATPTPSAPTHGQAFVAVLAKIGRETQKGEHLVEQALGAARNGQKVEPADLLALQAGIYRYGEIVDLTSKLVDRATQAVRTVTQGGGGG